MAYVVLVINDEKLSIPTLKDKTYLPTKDSEGISALTDYLASINGGLNPASIQLTVRDTNPSVTTSGTGSVQTTYNKS